MCSIPSDHYVVTGEHTEWGKHTNFDLATHDPLLIRAPWKPKSMGTHAKVKVVVVV